MRCAVMTAPGIFEIKRLPVPDLKPSEVRVHLEGCGVCGSNLPVWEGRPWFHYPLEPGAPGHEAWGTIDQVGDQVENLKTGQRVSILSSHGFAEYDIVTPDALVTLPSALDGVPFPGEPLGCAMNVFLRAQIIPGQVVAVVGIGFLGALLTSLSASSGARVIAMSRRHFALQMAKALNATETLVLDPEDRVIECVQEMTSGKGCDVVIEAAGMQSTLDLAGEICKVRGRLVIAGYHQDGIRRVNMQLWNWRGLDVINAHERDPRMYVAGIGRAIEAQVSGRMDSCCLYTDLFDLEELTGAFERLRTRPDGFMKGLVTYG